MRESEREKGIYCTWGVGRSAVRAKERGRERVTQVCTALRNRGGGSLPPSSLFPRQIAAICQIGSTSAVREPFFRIFKGFLKPWENGKVMGAPHTVSPIFGVGC